MADEILPLVDIEGNVTGCATRSECHNGSFKLHPVVHLHVYSTDNRLLLQLRSMNKHIQPGRWDTAVGGHVAYGESIEEALLRETSEELGISIDLRKVRFLGRYTFRSSIEYELVYVYSTVYDGPFDIQEEETDEVRFFTQDEIKAMYNTGSLTQNFEQEYLQIEPRQTDGLT
ncbi:MAG: NUDIX domain-containing protein [Candidatus Aphodosoma sp.]